MRALITISTLLMLCQANYQWADFSKGVHVIPSITEWRFRFWMQKFDKSYSSKEEYKFRYTQFKNTVKHVDYNNFRRKSTHKMALNKFADLSQEEWDKLQPVLPPRNSTEPRRTFNCTKDDICTLPDSVDWVKAGYITEAKETPAHCLGASYAFAAADTVEATYYNSTKSLKSFSPKQMMDCGQAYDMSQCDFGVTDDAFKYIKDGNPLMTFQDYPLNMNDKNCKYNKAQGQAGLNQIYAVQVQIDQIKQALQYGPVTTVVNSRAKIFQQYSGGIITSNAQDCDPKQASLSVVIVGYGKDGDQGYFYIKNNWGKGWGINGFVKISDSSDNICGILTPNYQYQISQ